MARQTAATRPGASITDPGGITYHDGFKARKNQLATIVANTGTSFAGCIYNSGATSSTLVGRQFDHFRQKMAVATVRSSQAGTAVIG